MNTPSESTLTPINEVRNERLFINMPIPRHIDAERIGVDVDFLTHMCEVAGMSRLALTGLSSENEEKPSIGGVDRSGNVTAGLSASANTSKRVHAVKQFNLPSEPFKAFITKNTWIEIDVPRMSRELAEKGQLQSVEAWTEALDKELKAQIGKVGLKFLLTPGVADTWRTVTLSMLSTGLALKMPDIPHGLIVGLTCFFAGEGMSHALKVLAEKRYQPEHSRLEFAPFGIEFGNTFQLWQIMHGSRKLVQGIVDVE